MIDLSRLPQEPSGWKDDKTYIKSTVTQIEVLSRNKMENISVRSAKTIV